MLRIKECAEFSGESEAVWRKRVGRGEIRIARLGRNVRVYESDLLEYVANRIVPPESNASVRVSRASLHGRNA
jgi:excisionase family DNA binding protein